MPISDYIKGLRAKIGNDLIMFPAVAAIIFNEAGEVLLQKRGDNGQWGIPGGMTEPGEEPAEGIIREVLEETGLHILPERISGVYGGALNTGMYPNGDIYALVSITFVCRVVGGTLMIDHDETLALQYFPPDHLPEPFMERHRGRIHHAATMDQPYFYLPTSDHPGLSE